MSKEIENVINNKYNNPELDRYIEGVLYASMRNLDMSTYMCARELRSNVITSDLLEDKYEHPDETTLGL